MQEKLAKDEESFRKTKEATGDNDINKVIQKFLVQAEYFKECDERRKATENRLQRAKDGRREAQKLLEDASAAGQERVSAKMQSDEATLMLLRLKTEEDEAKKRYIEAKQLQIEVKEGIRLICQKLATDAFDPAAAGLRDDDSMPHLPPAAAPQPELLDTDPGTMFGDMGKCVEFLQEVMWDIAERERKERERKEREEEAAKGETERLLLEVPGTGETGEAAKPREKKEPAASLHLVPEWTTPIKFADGADEEGADDDDAGVPCCSLSPPLYVSSSSLLVFQISIEYLPPVTQWRTGYGIVRH
jgi:hypothetical protein